MEHSKKVYNVLGDIVAKQYVRGSVEYHKSDKIVTRQKVELGHCRRLTRYLFE